MRDSLFFLLAWLPACGGLTQVTLDADPPVKILKLGEERIDEDTPYTFRPDDFVPEQKQDLRLRFEANADSGRRRSQQEYRWRIWYAYGGGIDQVQLPTVRPDGNFWLRRGNDHVLFVQTDTENALLVQNAWANRMVLATDSPEGSSSPRSEEQGSSTPSMSYRRVPPGSQILETRHWTIQVDLPAGLTLLYEEGAGVGAYVHMAFPKTSAAKPDRTEIQVTEGDAGLPVTPIPTRFLSMGRILEEELFSENYYAYKPDKELEIQVLLSGGRKLLLKCRPRSKAGTRPPLILCVCPGS